MSIYFDFKTIGELVKNKYYREQQEFTLDELSQYDGSNGRPAYVAIDGIVYDVSKEPAWAGGTHLGLTAGQDLTDQFYSCHGIIQILNTAPKIGVLTDDYEMNNMDEMGNMNNMNSEFTMFMNRPTTKQDTSKFTPDDWIRYIDPLVNYGLRETNQGMNMQRSYQKIILLGVLVGLGKTPQEAIDQVERWQTTGASQLLKGTTATGAGIGTTGSGMGTGGTTGTGGGIGTTDSGMGTGGTTTGTSGGFGTIGIGMGAGGGTTSGGFGTGSGTNTSGGMSAGGSIASGMYAGESTSDETEIESSNMNRRNRLHYD